MRRGFPDGGWRVRLIVGKRLARIGLAVGNSDDRRRDILPPCRIDDDRPVKEWPDRRRRGIVLFRHMLSSQDRLFSLELVKLSAARQSNTSKPAYNHAGNSRSRITTGFGQYRQLRRCLAGSGYHSGRDVPAHQADRRQARPDRGGAKQSCSADLARVESSLVFS